MVVIHSESSSSKWQQEGQGHSIPNLFFNDAVERQKTTNSLPFRFLINFPKQNIW